MKSSSIRLVAGLLVMALGFIFAFPVPHPALSQTPTPTTIESDASLVARAGNWTVQSAASASGGRYLYSSGSESDVLTLQFSGPSIEVVYVAGPSLGTLAINVDDTVLRTVITTQAKTAYQQTSRINYLSNTSHTLKVYAQKGGVVAVDAFVIPSLPTTEGSTSGQTRSTSCAPINAIHRVSLTSAGNEGTAAARHVSFSPNGRYVVYESDAPLVPGDGDAFSDIYLYDRQTCQLELISVSTAGEKGNFHSANPVISFDGRIIAFESAATNLIASDTNLSSDIFVRDRQTSTTTRVSVATGGVQADNQSFEPAISSDGRYIAFWSAATDLVAGDTNGLNDIFVHDRESDTTTRESVATGGTQATGGNSYEPAITPDGRYLAFHSSANNLIAGDTNGSYDVFIRDRQTDSTTRVSVATGGTQATGGNSYDATLSNDGRYVSFFSGAANLVAGDTNGTYDCFVHDNVTNTTTRVSVATGGTQTTGGDSYDPKLSGDGRYVTFWSDSTNLVAGDTNSQFDVFVHDRNLNTTSRVSVAANGSQAIGGTSIEPAISNDGRYIGFSSEAVNLINGDANAVADIFVTPRVRAIADTLALFNPSYNQVNLVSTLQDNPPYTAFTAFSAYAPISGGQWVMGDWDGDGQKTPGVYNNGPFFYTNKFGESQSTDWHSLWIGVSGPPVAGHLNGTLANDCIGAVQQATLSGFTVFVLYYTCDLSGVSPTPTISSQWLSSVLPDSLGLTGQRQFSAGDFDGDGVDTIAVRRDAYIAYTNVNAPLPAEFGFAQYIGAPASTDYGRLVVGDWDVSGADSFGLFYQNGELFYRNDLAFNSGIYVNQSVGTPFGNSGVQVATWR